MRLGRFLKDAQDRKRYVVDYEDWLDEEEIVSGVTVTGSVDDPDNPTGEFVVDGYVIGDSFKTIVYYVSGGIPENEYNATITIETNYGQVKEDWITHVVT